MCIAPGALHPVHDNNNQSCKLFSTCGFCLQVISKSAGVSSLLQEARASHAYWCTLLSCRILEFEQAFPSHKRTCSRRHSPVTDLHTSCDKTIFIFEYSSVLPFIYFYIRHADPAARRNATCTVRWSNCNLHRSHFV